MDAQTVKADLERLTQEDENGDAVIYGYSDGPWSALAYEDYNAEALATALPYKVEVEATVGGGEGSGEEMYLVLKTTDGESVQYFRKDGYYASFDGSNWDGAFYEVTPTQKTITVYPRKK